MMVLVFSNSNVKTDYAIGDDSYDIHSLSFGNLNTNNFLNYFSDIDVIRIYPYINPIYKDSLGYVSYKMNGVDSGSDIERFKESYLSLIKKNSFLDYNYLYVNGINIGRIDVYLSDEQLDDLINDGSLIISVIK